MRKSMYSAHALNPRPISTFPPQRLNLVGGKPRAGRTPHCRLLSFEVRGLRGESGPKVLVSKGRHTGTRQEGMGDREGGDGR